MEAYFDLSVDAHLPGALAVQTHLLLRASSNTWLSLC